MEGIRKSLVLVAVGALIGASFFVAGYGFRALVSPAVPVVEYHNTMYYQNGTFASGPSLVADTRTIIRFDLPAPCLSYVESRHTGTPNSIEFWVYVEAGNTHDLEGWAYHSWTEGSTSHREVIFTFDVGVASPPGGGTQTGAMQFYVAHPGLEWPSTTDWQLFCR